eukprot:1157846-Pelagomonas_calceolata.AAC.3
MQGFEKEGCGSSGFLMHCQLNLHLGIPASQGMIFLLVSQIMTMFFRAYEQTQSKNHTGRQKQCSFSIVNPPLNQSMIKVVPAEMRSPISWEACELTCPRRSSALPSYATGTLLRECYHGVQEFKSSTNSQLTDDCTLHSPPPKKTPIKQTTVQIWKEAKQKGGDFSKGMRVLGLYKLASILARSSSSNMLLVAERFVHGNKQKREVLKYYFSVYITCLNTLELSQRSCTGQELRENKNRYAHRRCAEMPRQFAQIALGVELICMVSRNIVFASAAVLLLALSAGLYLRPSQLPPSVLRNSMASQTTPRIVIVGVSLHVGASRLFLGYLGNRDDREESSHERETGTDGGEWPIHVH